MIMDDALPGIKAFFKATSLKATAVLMLTRLVAAFTCHLGRMSATQAAGAIRSQSRHRAAMIRFLAQLRWSRDWQVLSAVANLLLQAENLRGGLWIFIVDQTYCGQPVWGGASGRRGQRLEASIPVVGHKLWLL